MSKVFPLILVMLSLSACGFPVGGTPYPGVGGPATGADIGSNINHTIRGVDCDAQAPIQGLVCGGLKADYYAAENFTGTLQTKIDSSIRFWSDTGYGKHPDWSFPTGIPSSKFSVRWSGYVRIPENLPWLRLCALSSDHMRIYFGNLDRGRYPYIEHWQLHGPGEDCGELVGQMSNTMKGLQPIVIDFDDDGGGAAMILHWRYNGTIDSYISGEQLYHEP